MCSINDKNIKVLEDVIFVFFTFNQEKYLPYSLPAAFNQTCFPSKLVIMDDASTDNSDEIIKELVLAAPANLKIEYHKNEKNIGLIAQINKLVNKFENKLIIVQAGDDESYPHRVEVTHREWLKNNRPSLLLANHDDISEKGELIKPFSSKKNNKQYTLKRIINRRALVYGCCAAFDSDLLNYYGPISDGVINEDRVNIFRAYFKKGVIYLHRSLLKYRSGVGISAHSTASKEARCKRVVVEAVRELQDLDCHFADLKKINHPDVERMLLARKKTVEWQAKITPSISFLDVLTATCYGANLNAAIKTFKKVNKQK